MRRSNRVMEIWFGAIRVRTLPAAVAPVLVGSALAWSQNFFDGLAAGLCLLFALLIQVGTNFANDYYDAINGADTSERVGPVRAVAAGLIEAKTMRRAMFSVLALAFILGLSLIYWGGPWLLIIGVASVLCAIAYTGGPYPLGYNGLGDLFVFIFFGLVAVGASFYVQSGFVSREALAWSVPIGLLAVNILVVNNYRDVDTDRIAGKRTLVVRWGRGFARGQFTLSLVIALLFPVFMGALTGNFRILLPCLLGPMAYGQIIRLRDSKTPSQLIELLGDSGKLLAFYAILLSVGLILSRA